MKVYPEQREFARAICAMWPTLTDDQKREIGETISLDMGSGQIAELLACIISFRAEQISVTADELQEMKEDYLHGN